eukprot:773877-Alexandrium_andersonii.AAC.1
MWSETYTGRTRAATATDCARTSAKSMQRLPAHRVGTPGEATFHPSVAAMSPKSSSSSSRFQSPAAMQRA